MSDIVIVAAARTPQGRLKGQLASFTAPQLGSMAIRGALEQASIAPDAVDAVIMGQVLAAGSGQNAARQAAVGAGIGWDVPASSVNKVCLSGLTAIIDAARMIRTGDATTVVAGGMESMTRAPHLLMGSRDGWTYGSVEVIDHMAYDGLTDAYDRESMGASTERHNPRFEMTREIQDTVAALSHQRAAAAQADGVFGAEIVEVSVPQRKGEPVVLTKDEGVRPETTVESLAGLRPAFAEGGTITAGNASQISDGASAVVVTTRENAEAEGWPVLAVIGANGQTAGRTTRCRHSRRARSSGPSRSRASPPISSTSSRSTRPSARSSHARSRSWGCRATSSTSTAAASPSGIRSARAARDWSCTWRTSWPSADRASRSPHCAVAAARARR